MLGVFPVLSLTDHLQTCPEQVGTLQQVSVCVQTETEQCDDPFPLLSHLTDTTSPPTTKTSYTGHSLPHIYPQFSQDVDNCQYKISMDNMVSPETAPLILIGWTVASIPPIARLHSLWDFYQCLTKWSISACFHGEDFFIRS